MLDLRVDAKQLKALQSAVSRSKKSFGKELAAAINAVAKDAKTKISRDISSEITMPPKDIKSRISTRGKATAQTPVAVVSLGWKKREGLQYFKARQTNKGVSYKISKKAGKRSTVLGAFMGPSPGILAPKLHGGVFKRIGKGRLPIAKLRAVSAAGAFVKNKHDKILPWFIKEKLHKQVERRIKLNVLRANGLVSK